MLVQVNNVLAEEVCRFRLFSLDVGFCHWLSYRYPPS